MKTNANDFSNCVWKVTELGENKVFNPGLTKLEHFSSLALQGLLASGRNDYNCGGVYMTVDEASVFVAKTLINALNAEHDKNETV